MGSAKHKAKGDGVSFANHLFNGNVCIGEACTKGEHFLFDTFWARNSIRMGMINILCGKDFISQSHISCFPHLYIASHQCLVCFEIHAFPLFFNPGTSYPTPVLLTSPGASACNSRYRKQEDSPKKGVNSARSVTCGRQIPQVMTFSRKGLDPFYALSAEHNQLDLSRVLLSKILLVFTQYSGWCPQAAWSRLALSASRQRARWQSTHCCAYEGGLWGPSRGEDFAGGAYCLCRTHASDLAIGEWASGS